MAFLATLRRQSMSVPWAVPALRAGRFALYTPSQAIAHFAAPPAFQPGKDAAVASCGAAAAPSALFGLLTGTLEDANHFAGNEGAAWLADMARGICCPRAVGDGLLMHDPASGSWRKVGNTEPLVAASYLYQPLPNVAVGLQMLYQRTGTVSSFRQGGAEELRRRLEGRDGVCWINRVNMPLNIARVLPKNMPNGHKLKVLEEFASPGTTTMTAPFTSARDIRLVLFLCSALEHYFERFWLGFRCTGKNSYVCHSFIDGPECALDISGMAVGPTINIWPRVHGRPVAPPNLESNDLPSAALFRWHYLQCVLKKFKHSDYLGVPNIRVPPADDWFDDFDFDYDPEEDFDWDTRVGRRTTPER